MPSAAAPPADAATLFDGRWSVSIVTEAGDTCDRAYRYALRITDGNITYDDPSFDVSGARRSQRPGQGRCPPRAAGSSWHRPPVARQRPRDLERPVAVGTLFWLLGS